MTVSRHALKEFLARELDDHTWIKDVSRRKLMRHMHELRNGNGFRFITKPYEHQVACFLLGICHSGFLFLLDMGTGKSKIALDVFRFRCLEEEAEKSLILAPRDTNVDGWIEQIEEHSDLTYQGLVGSTKEKWEAFDEDAQVYIVSYPGFLRMVSTLKPAPKGNKNKLVINDSLIRKIMGKVDTVILDEVHRAKGYKAQNKQSLTFKVCNRLSKQAKFVYGLTGTPFGRDPAALWPQFYLIDRGETLGEEFGLFREAMFVEKKNWFGREWVFDNKNKRKLYRMLRHRSIRYKDSECSDLPKKVVQKVSLTLTKEAASYYAPAAKSLKAARGNFAEIKIGFMKMREICSGFIQWKEEKSKDHIRFKENPKIEALKELVEDMPPEAKMIVFHFFTESGKMIEEALTEIKIPWVSIRGGKSGKHQIEQARKFKQDLKYRVLVANIDSVKEGGNYQVAAYTAFFELPVSPIDFRQCEKRTHRGGQRQRTHFYYFLTKGTVEEKIYRFLLEGRNLFSAVLEGERI